jgi:glycosyltransferase involved in cell wall biosynthesis
MGLDRMADLLRRGKADTVILADQARDAGRWELAAQLYKKALNRNPLNSPIWVQYGHSLKEAGQLRDPDKLAQAEVAYRRALSLDPGVADAHLQLGHVLKLQGKIEEARAAYLRAITLDSSLQSAAFELTQFGWSEAHFSELHRMLGTDTVEIDNFGSDAGPPTGKSREPSEDGRLHAPIVNPRNATFFPDSEASSSSQFSPDVEPILGRGHDAYVGESIIDRAVDESAPETAPKRHVFPSSTAILTAQTPAISVIMPTHNRGELMERSIEKYIACCAHVDAELIVIDDGSRDDTPNRLQRLARLHPNLVTDRITNSGPARARNLACSMARGTILLFVGDDIMPADDDFLRIHLAAHRRFPDLGQAILGKISWPNAIDFPVNFVMAFVQGDGQQQFGYKHMQAYARYSWPAFYTSNVSVKRRIVQDWEKDGFDTSFTMAAFEDGEFALRLTERFQAIGEDFGLLYVPAANAVHFHPFTVESFVRRQVSVGMMAARFLELHPEREADLGLCELIARLKTDPDQTNFPIDHYLAIFEGLRAWLSVIENHYGLGTQNWHGDALGAIFHLAYLEGYMRSQAAPDLNYASACRYMLETVRTDFNRTIFSEVIGNLPGFGFA